MPQGGDTTDQELARCLLDLLRRTAGGVSAQHLGQAVHVPTNVVQAVLIELQRQGQVRFRKNRWHGVGAVQPGWSPSQNLSPPRIITPAVDRSENPADNSSGRTIPIGSSRWSDFRRLCLYYAECIRLEQGTSVKAYSEAENRSFVMLNSQLDWRSVAGGAPIAMPIGHDWATFSRSLRSNRTTTRAYLGTPLDVFRGKSRDSDVDLSHKFLALRPVF